MAKNESVSYLRLFLQILHGQENFGGVEFDNPVSYAEHNDSDWTKSSIITLDRNKTPSHRSFSSATDGQTFDTQLLTKA